MKKHRRNRLITFILCISIIAGSLAPASTVRASERNLSDALIQEKEESTGISTPTPTPVEEGEETQAPTEAGEEAASPSETPTSTGEENASASPSETPSPTGDEDASASPSETPSPTGDEDASASPSETPSPTGTGEVSASPSETPTPTAAVSPTPSETPTPSLVKASSEEDKDLDYVLGRPMTEEEIAYQESLEPDNLPVLPEETVVEGYESGVSFLSTMPEKYDARDYDYITSVKNQNPYGSCWTYASIASMESSLVSQGIVTADNIDLSEWHMAYYATHSGSDELGNTAGDYVNEISGIAYMNNGGNANMAIVALSNWKGAARENDYPGNSDTEELQAAGEALTKEDAWKNNAYYLDEAYMVPATDSDGIKKMVQAYGAAYASYYHESSYLNYDTAAYYCQKTYTNHAITVIGWDDSYSKDNFNTTPEGDGAWLCKNSWGDTMGIDGYFYISYYDTSFQKGNVAVFVGKESDSKLNNYYYGGGVDIATYVYTKGIAQCFTAKANPDGLENIVGTGFYSYSSGVNYSIQVYLNPDTENGVVTDPESGEAMFETPEEGTTAYAGYYTVDFTTPVEVEDGDIFSVVITFGKSVAIPMDSTYTLTSGSVTVYDSVNTDAPGESFSKPSGYSQFISLYEEDGSGYTPRMNVFTQDKEREVVIHAYRMEGEQKEKIGEFCLWSTAVEAVLAEEKTDGEYLFEIQKDMTVKGALTIPEGIKSLTVLGASDGAEPVEIKVKQDADGIITAGCDLYFENISIVNTNKQKNLETLTLDANGHTLTLGDKVTFDRPLLLKGSNGTLQIKGQILTAGVENWFRGTISGFARVEFDESLSLSAYSLTTGLREGGTLTAEIVEQNADVKVEEGVIVTEYTQKEGTTLTIGIPESAADAVIGSYYAYEGSSCEVTGKFTSGKKVELYGEEEEGKGVFVKAGQIAFQEVTLFYAKIQSDAAFTIAGTLTGQTEGNRLITRQKTDGDGKVSDVYLTVNGSVYLEDKSAPIEVLVKQPGITDEDAFLEQSPTAYGLLLHAKEADALCFAAAAENSAGEVTKTVKRNTEIYVYYEKEVPVELVLMEDGQETTFGYFVTFAEAVAFVEARKDKTAEYAFVLHYNLGEESAIKLTMPSQAAAVTVRKAESVEKAVIHLAEDISLKTATAFEGITLSPDYGNQLLNVQMNKCDLTLKRVSFEEGCGLNTITADTKEAAVLTLSGVGEEATYTAAGGITVSKLILLEKVTLTCEGKLTVGDLALEAGAHLIAGGKSSVITNIMDFVPYESERESSLVEISANGDLTIKNQVSSSEGGALWIRKEGAEAVESQEEITTSNLLLTAEKASASAFRAGSMGTVPFKHNKSMYLPGENAIENGLLKVALVTGTDEGESSRFLNWSQAIAEINSLGNAGASFTIRLLQDIELSGTLTVPAKGKCSILKVEGQGHELSFKGTVTLSTITLILDQVMITDGLGRNIKGDGKNSILYLINGSELKVQGNVTGLKGFYLGMDEGENPAGKASVLISGKLETGTLGIRAETANDFNDTSLVVMGQLTSGTLKGENGVLTVRQTSAKNQNTLAKVTGIAGGTQDKPLTVLVMKPDITSIAGYEEKLAKGENPFVEEVMEIPLIKAAVMSAHSIQTAQVLITEESCLLEVPGEAVYYKDSNQYIRAGQKENMRIRITAETEEGLSSVTYAASWYEAVQNLNRMANHYSYYQLELLEDACYLTGFNTKTKTEKAGKLLLPTKVRGTVEVRCAEGVTASVAYTGEMKVSNKMTLVWNGVPFTQINQKGKEVSKSITVNSGSSLMLIKETDSCQNISKIAASKGSLILDDTQITASGAVNVKQLLVSDAENKISGKAKIQIQFIYGYADAESEDSNGDTEVENPDGDDADADGTADEAAGESDDTGSEADADFAGKVILETVSTYKKSKGSYAVSALSQISITGAVAENAKVLLHLTKDSSKVSEDADGEYELSELLVQSGEVLSAKKRLAVVSGNVADGRIVVIDSEDSSLIREGESYLITEKGGLYLVDQEPLIRVVSNGGTTDDYLGSFRSLDAALNAVTTSAKKDISLSKKNQKEYQVIFIKQPETGVRCKLPTNVKKLVFTQEVQDECMPLSLTGGLSFSKKDGTVEFENLALTMTGKISISNLTLRQASLETKGDVSLKNVSLTDSLLRGRNITVSTLTEMDNSQLCAVADNKEATGKLVLNKLTDKNQDRNGINLLAANGNKKGISQITIKGTVTGLAERSGENACFAIMLYQNRNAENPLVLTEGMRLLTAAKADSSFFRPAFTDVDGTGMGDSQEGFGCYKKGNYIYYGDLS